MKCCEYDPITLPLLRFTSLPTCLSLEEVAVHAAPKVLMKAYYILLIAGKGSETMDKPQLKG